MTETTDIEALEQRRKHLTAGEKIFVFGPGGEKNTNKIPALKKLFGFTVFAIALGTIGWVVPLPPGVTFVLGICPLLILPYIFWVVTVELANDTNHDDCFFALTNNRLMMIDYRGITTIANRSEIKRMHATEKSISLYLSNRALLIKKLKLEKLQ